MSSYAEQRAWAEQFMPQVKQIVGPLLLEPASFELDTSEATDLIVMRARDMRIGVRIRKRWVGEHEQFKWQFTMRSKNGASKTELQKVTEGFGDWLFYGFANEDTGEIFRWYVVNLDAWRTQMIRDKAIVFKGTTNNGDGTWFTWFDVRTFTVPILVASSHEVGALLPAAMAAD